MIGRKQLKSLIVGAVSLYLLIWLLAILHFHTIVSKTDENASNGSPVVRDQSIKRSPKKNGGRENIDGDIHVIVEKEPWYGWQPEIPASMECSWRECFKPKHTCTTCRDSPQDLAGNVFDPGADWIPDVTMLRRMYLDGRDADGNPWPPALDDELCDPIGDFGGNSDGNKVLLDAVPIVGPPMIKESKGGKVLCMIYTIEKNHATNIRAMRETWAPGCDGFLAFSTKTDPRIPAISIPHKGEESYNNMWQKIRSMWNFVGKHYQSDFDWFYIGGEVRCVWVLIVRIYNILCFTYFCGC